MSYRPSRAPASPSPPDASNPHGRSSSQQSLPSASQAQSSNAGQGQSPLDWTNFINYPTPPVHNAGPAGNGMRGPTGHSQQYGQMEQGRQDLADNGAQGGQGGSSGQDEFTAFAQGIAMNRQQPGSISFQHTFPHRSSSTSTSTLQSQHAYQPQPSPHHRNLQLGPTAGPSRSPSKGKGKSPAASTAALQPDGTSQHDNAGQDGQNLDNGLTLDADAFSRDIRFQVPSFLSNQMTGAPSFPAGGEAWSGFGAGIFQDGGGGAGGGQLTPGTLFNNAFGLTESNHYGNEQSGGGRNVLDGLSGFLGDGQWDSWDKTDTAGGGATGGSNINNNVNNGQAPTTFYVNPNPSPNVLAQRAQQGQQPQQQQVQPPQPPPHQHPHQLHQPHQAQVDHRHSQSSHQRPNLSTLDVNAAQHQSHAVSQSPRNTTATQPSHLPSPRNATAMPAQNRAATTMPSPHSSNPTSMPTSAIFPQPPHNGSFYAPSLSTPTNNQSASTVNIASSSTQPYAPPANTQALLSGPPLPGIVGPSLSDGPGLYSTTGFDMVGVLARVAGRKDPKTVLGPVDQSCSFLVVDVRRYDSPIVYASPTFQALTGYDLPQILGRNCRFLQGPDGEVVKGSKRKYTDNVAVAHMKRMLNAGKECQASLINYRRGGIPFINLITVVPIPWEGTDIVYHVGFQVDLVEQPNAILRNMRDGSYQVNYTVTNPPQPMLRPPGREGGLGLSQEIVDILGPRVNQPGFAMGEEGGKMEWLKMVLENADDFIHVLSLKGLFQYVSPSVRRVLEYEPEDLLNKNISDICHPSDIVPLMRELKDSTHAPADGNALRKVHLVFRIRRKSSGYVWIECNGRLHIEAGKGRKAVILSGRGLAVPTLPWEHVARNGGLGEKEAWMKVSFDGLILHATSTINDLLGKSVDKVVGQSIFSLMPGGENGPPPHHDQTSANARLASAFRTSSSGETLSALTVRLQLLRYNNIVDVTAVIYPPRSLEIPALSDADEDSPMSDTSRRLSTSSTSSGGIKPSSLIIQIKVNSNVPNRPIAHPASTNIFEELETTRGTSWQYELHQLRLLNRRFKEDISGARARGKKVGSKKRKADHGLGEMGPPGSAGTGSTGTSGGGRVPEKFTAAPRHQLTPGFGLVAPGTYFQ